MEYVGTLYGKIARLEAEVKRLQEENNELEDRVTHEQKLSMSYFTSTEKLQSQLSDKDRELREAQNRIEFLIKKEDEW